MGGLGDGRVAIGPTPKAVVVDDELGVIPAFGAPEKFDELTLRGL
jgi:hypothetical protein